MYILRLAAAAAAAVAFYGSRGSVTALPAYDASQHVLLAAPQASPPAEPSDLSGIVFSSIHGLLKSWSQAFAPNGRSVIPGYIPAGTQLYHGGSGSVPPLEGFEWVALDAEHAYLFGSHGSNARLFTFVAMKDLPILYFDGFSASKMNTGTLDLQDALVFGANLSNSPHVQSPGEFVRARYLCDWGKEHGIQGFVREEATFELIWCDFSSKDIKLVRSVNTTILGDLEGPFDSLPPATNILTLHDSYSAGPPPRSPPQTSEINAYQQGTMWRMLNAASWHYIEREPRVRLSVSHMATLNDARYTSLYPTYAHPTHERRLTNISASDLSAFKHEMAESVAAWHQERYNRHLPDYLAIVDAIASRLSDRLLRMQAVLSNSSNATLALQSAKLEAFAILFPYLDTPMVLSTGKYAPSPEERHIHVTEATEMCRTAFTGHLIQEGIRYQERRVRDSIEGVLNRVCRFAGSVLDLEDTPTAEPGIHAQKGLRRELSELMTYLSWPAWSGCEGGCAAGEICFVSMWPLIAPIDRRPGPPPRPPGRVSVGRPTPKCVSADDFTMHPP